ncbi:hypothetical protein BC941DRAFT_497390 [Chlamydoabsidia padenii]|nr:hypothetical protein BC941DRAFT_497390 [Chlamydoabsidia padenii]
MGATASKQVARKLPTTARPETLRSVPRESPSTLQQTQLDKHTIDIKNDNKDDIFGDMEQERSNPQLLENLAKLGPVTIPPTITRMRQSDSMLGILRERQRVEKDEQTTTTNNRITTDALFSLLEHRKHLAPDALPRKWEELSKECGGVDVSALKVLFKYYNTITVMPPANPEDKSERRQGIWVNNRVEWKTAVDETHQRHQRERQAKENALRDTEHTLESQQQSKESQQDRRERHLKDLFVD